MPEVCATHPDVRRREFHLEDLDLDVAIEPDVLDDIFEYAEKTTSETGGVLVGHAEGTSATITEPMGPARDSVSSELTFDTGTVGVAEWLSHRWDRHGVAYVGEWHTHPRASPEPSATDKRAMQNIATDEGYDCPMPVLLIVGGSAATGYEISLSLQLEDEAFYTFEEIDGSDEE